ncbi:MAG: hypothetical protein KME27_26715 [Lyngbya sp. HA4199-MV5]|nr:hypothetical protein [Lyngbya sp. HA4199-MV5]
MIDDFPYLQTQAIQVLEAIAKIMLSQERNSSVGAVVQINDAGEVTPVSF